MAAPYLEFDIANELEQLHREPGWQSGQNAKTLVKYDDLRAVRHFSQARDRARCATGGDLGSQVSNCGIVYDQPVMCAPLTQLSRSSR